MAKPLLESRPT